jgi:single-strand DNA-binding protein
VNINRIIISGNLVANPILRETNARTPVASATIANNEFFSDGEGERQQITTFIDVTVWGKSAENFASLAKKGQEVIIEGQLRRNDWETEDGQKHSKHFLKAEIWQFTQYRRQEDITGAAPEKEIKETKKAASKKAT